MKMMRLEDEGEKRISKSFGPMGSHYWGHTGHEKWKETVGVGLCHLAAVAILSSVPK